MCILSSEKAAKNTTNTEGTQSNTIIQNKDETNAKTAMLPKIDLFLNNEKRQDLKQMEKVMKEMMYANFPVQEIGQNFSSLFNLLWHSSLPCYSKDGIPGSEYLLKKCLLHGQEVDCAKLFKPVPTDLGICCSFNHKNVLKDSEFSKMLLRKQKGNDNDDKDESSHFVEIGHTMGLEIFVDQHSNRVTAGSVSSKSKYNL